jgi:hypothetical protein
VVEVLDTAGKPTTEESSDVPVPPSILREILRLDQSEDEQFFACTTAEKENFELRKELCLVTQERDELAAKIDKLQKDAEQLNSMLTVLTVSRDVWKELAEKYERILKGDRSSSQKWGS